MGGLSLSDNAVRALEKSCLRTNREGKVCETPLDMFLRVAGAVAETDLKYDPAAKVESVEQQFCDMMTELYFLPDPSILRSAGNPSSRSCGSFVLPLDSSVEGAFEALKDAALIRKAGGQTGFSLSHLRAKEQGGPDLSSFVQMIGVSASAIAKGSAGLCVLRADHPDIMKYLTREDALGGEPSLAVGITDELMTAVEENGEFALYDPRDKSAAGRLNARDVFRLAVERAWRSEKSAAVFLDKIESDNPAPALGALDGVTPDDMLPLLPYEGCCKGSINLGKMLRNGADGAVEIDTARLQQTVYNAVHFLDNAIDIVNYPFEAAKQASARTRKIGLGVMGFADMLLELAIPYDSDEAAKLADMIMDFIRRLARDASKRLAKDRGAFPALGDSVFASDEPLRNAALTSIASDELLSQLADCASGIEPVAFFAKRRDVDGETETELNAALNRRLIEEGLLSDEVLDRIIENGSLDNMEELPEEIRRAFRCAADVSPEEQIKIQAAFQKHTDGAAAAAVRFCKEAERADIAEAYITAYKRGCKCLTIIHEAQEKPEPRQPELTNEIERAEEQKKTGESEKPKEPAPARERPAAIEPRECPDVAKGLTERIKTGCGNLYVTVNFDDKGICEVLTSTDKGGGCPSLADAVARLASVSLRGGLTPEAVCSQLKGIRCLSSDKSDEQGCVSCPDAIAGAIDKAAVLQKVTFENTRI